MAKVSPIVSVVIVSRDRPESLIWCLTGVTGLRYPAFEVVVVTDDAGIAAVRAVGLEGRVKLIRYDEANISVARNVGIAAAAGEIIAFIDDDAVPEPTWLSHLTGPFAAPEMAAAGGYVRGRNGISFQWRARSVDRGGSAQPIALRDAKPMILKPTPEKAIKTEGTNMAVRREVLVDLGGFDPAYRFFLDETDLNIRLADAGHLTAIVPMAQVHHAYAESPRRRRNRGVIDLFEVGASQMVFLRKHASEDYHRTRIDEMRAEQRTRMIEQMVAGLIEPGEVEPVLDTLEAGFTDGSTRPHSQMPELGLSALPFLPFSPIRGPVEFFAGRPWQTKHLREAAGQVVQQGGTATVMIFGPSARPHRLRFTDDGFWEQTGGIFGPSDRSDKKFFAYRFEDRVERETGRVSSLRGHPE